jgi:hypothetical protein
MRYGRVLPENLEYLIDLGVARKQRCSFADHLRKDAADRPHVDSRGIVARAKKDFWCSVPQRHHLQAQMGSVSI